MTHETTFADAAARTRAAADAARPAREFDPDTFRPVRGDHLEHVIKELAAQRRILAALCEAHGIDPNRP